MRTISKRGEGWKAGGIVTGRGLLDRPLPSFGLPVPARLVLDARGDRLLYQWGDEGLVPVPEDLLTRFVRLGETGDGKAREPLADELLTFARAFGPLNAWEVDGEWDRFRASLPRGWTGEPLEFWRYYTAATRAVLEIAARLRTRGNVFVGLWRLLCRPQRVSDAPHMLQGIINKWLRVGEVAPTFLWDPKADRQPEDAPRLVMDAGSLFGHLAIQLATAVAGMGGWAFCASCHQPFWIKEGKRGRRPLYCDRPTCGERARWRHARAKAYAKEQRARKVGNRGKASR